MLRCQGSLTHQSSPEKHRSHWKIGRHGHANASSRQRIQCCFRVGNGNGRGCCEGVSEGKCVPNALRVASPMCRGSCSSRWCSSASIGSAVLYGRAGGVHLLVPVIPLWNLSGYRLPRREDCRNMFTTRKSTLALTRTTYSKYHSAMLAQ